MRPGGQSIRHVHNSAKTPVPAAATIQSHRESDSLRAAIASAARTSVATARAWRWPVSCKRSTGVAAALRPTLRAARAASQFQAARARSADTPLQATAEAQACQQRNNDQHRHCGVPDNRRSPGFRDARQEPFDQADRPADRSSRTIVEIGDAPDLKILREQREQGGERHQEQRYEVDHPTPPHRIQHELKEIRADRSRRRRVHQRHGVGEDVELLLQFAAVCSGKRERRIDVALRLFHLRLFELDRRSVRRQHADGLRQRDRGVAVVAADHPRHHAAVHNWRDILAHERLDITRLIAPQRADSCARIVDAASRRCECEMLPLHDWLEREPFLFRLLDHPAQRHVREAIVRISTADIGMHTGKPDLREAIGSYAAVFLALRLGSLVPGDREEGSALVIEAKACLACRTRSNSEVSEPHRPDPFVDRHRELIDRKAIGRDRVPETYKMDGDCSDRITRLGLTSSYRMAPVTCPEGDQQVARNGQVRPRDPGRERFFAEGA